ncbi:MAG: M48 family metallopeptidase [Planctomycetia bacterium]|nr:M48 family metallopeptidase [Planctomycetia bacterium]
MNSGTFRDTSLETISREILTPEELREIREYNRSDFVWGMVDRLVDLVYLTVMTFGVAAWLDTFLESAWGLENGFVRGAVFILILMGGHILVSFPISYYSGYVLEKRYGLSALTVGGWLRRYALRMLLATAMNLVVLLALLAMIRSCGEIWWLVAAGVFFLFSMLLGMLVPVWILPMFYPIERLEREDLRERFQRLTADTTLKIEGVYRMEMSVETVKANAMLAGVGKTRRVLLGDTLLEHFSPEEIEAVFAHEVGHHVYGHLWKMMVGMLGLSFLLFWGLDFLLRQWVGEPFSYATLPVWTLSMFLWVSLLVGWLLEPLQNGISRYFERQSDAYAVRKRGDGEALATAFIQLAKQNKADPNPPWLEVFWMHSHPSLAERIRNARQFSEIP